MYLGNVVEVIPGEDLADKAVHPYTQALMGAIFDIHMDFSKPIESIESEAPSPLDVPEGEAPSPLELPEGCPFQNRCESCMEICRQKQPDLVELEPGHCVACHLVR